MSRLLPFLFLLLTSCLTAAKPLRAALIEAAPDVQETYLVAGGDPALFEPIIAGLATEDDALALAAWLVVEPVARQGPQAGVAQALWGPLGAQSREEQIRLFDEGLRELNK